MSIGLLIRAASPTFTTGSTPRHRISPLDDVLQQVTVVARHLDHERVLAQPEPISCATTNCRACSTHEVENEEK